MRPMTSNVAASVLLLACAGASVCAEPVSEKKGGAPPTPALEPDEVLLQDAHIGLEHAALRNYLLKAVRAEAASEQIDALISQLGAARLALRDQARRKLVEFGPPALPALRPRVHDADAEIAKRAEECIAAIEKKNEQRWARVVVRVMAERGDPELVELLLQYLPFAGDPELEADIWYAVQRWAKRDKLLDRALVAALTDKQPARRALAACVVGRMGTSAQKAEARKLLTDPDAGVRLRAAQGLLAGKDKSVLPALIDLLGDADLEIAWQAEELLRFAAGEGVGEPSRVSDRVIGTGDVKARKQCQSAWLTWWQEQGAKVDLAALEKLPRRPGLYLVTDRDGKRVYLVGCDGKVRWEMKDLAGLVDARPTPGGVLLVQGPSSGEKVKPCVTHFDWQRQLHWEFTDLKDPQTAHRLPTGETFIADFDFPPFEIWPRLAFVVVDAQGKTVSDAGDQPPDGVRRCEAMFQHHDGRIVCLSVSRYARGGRKWRSLGSLDEYAPPSDRVRHIPVPSNPSDDVRSLEPTGDGDLVAVTSAAGAMSHQPNLFILDGNGDNLWEHWLAGVNHAVVWRGGNVAVALPDRIAEIAPDHRMVGEILCGGCPMHVRPSFSLVRFGFDVPVVNLDLRWSVEYRIGQLKSKDARVRVQAANCLAQYRGFAAGAITELKAAMDDPDERVRAAVKKAFVAAGGELIPELLAAYAKEKDPEQRAKIIGEVGSYHANSEVLSLVLAALKDQNETIRWYAAIQLRCPRSDAKTVPALIQAMSDSSERVRASAARSLGLYAEQGRPAIPALIKGIKEGNTNFGSDCMDALCNLGRVDEHVLPFLIDALKDRESSSGCMHAAKALAGLGPRAEPALSDLIDTFTTRDHRDHKLAPLIRESALLAIGRIGPAAKPAVPLLIMVVRDSNELPVLRQQAAESLAMIGRPATNAIPALEKACKTSKDAQFVEVMERHLKCLHAAQTKSRKASIPKLERPR